MLSAAAAGFLAIVCAASGTPARDESSSPDPGRFRPQAGFAIDVVAEPGLTGSVVNLTFDTRGRPVVSRENGPVFILDAPDGDGKYTQAKELTRAVTNCQGLLAWDARTFYLVGNGPEGTGLYRVADRDGDDAAEEVRLIHRFRGTMQEHGPHAVVAGPDGFLYLAVGNMAWVSATPEPTSPVEKMYEGDLLPRYDDASGHANGVKVPGGTIWRVDPEGRRFSLEAAGLRNHFDLAFNSLGEIFTFDSDMELQEGLPFYQPVRILHAVPGADFGWRSNDGKWPPTYADTLPALKDVGRGSPCGVVVYNHRQFPAEYTDAVFLADWSLGRILVVRPERDGATFRGDVEEFVTGKPLNVTDLDVAPDGSLFFSTGGRGTQGGVYRVRFTSGTPPAPPAAAAAGAAAVRAALAQPQPQSAWGRHAVRTFKSQAGDAWCATLQTEACDRSSPPPRRLRALAYLCEFGPEPDLTRLRRLTLDEDPEIRAQAAVALGRRTSAEAGADLQKLLGDPAPVVRRRAAEGLIRTGTHAPLEALKPLLADPDRFTRYAARLALERTDPALWAHAALADPDPRVVVMALLSLNKLGVVATDRAAATNAFDTLARLLEAKLPPGDELDALRALELTILNAAKDARPPSLGSIGKRLLDRFPTGDRPLDRELSRLLGALSVSGCVEKLLRSLEGADRPDAIHLARCLVAVTDDWTEDQRRRFRAWLNVAREWKGGGGPSYGGFIGFIRRDAAARWGEPAPAQNGAPEVANVERTQPARAWTEEELVAHLGKEVHASMSAGRAAYEKAACGKCHRFADLGGGSGPDLTTLSSRFSRKDMLDAILRPSQVIPEQYRAVRAELKDGRIFEGMKGPDDGKNLMLILSDGSTIKLSPAEVVKTTSSDVSPMPEGLLNTLELREVAALFALLEGRAVQEANEKGFRALFNGKDLEGWSATRPKLWSVRDSIIVGRQDGSLAANTFLATREKFSDFVLRLSVRLPRDVGNSGVQFRTEIRADGSAQGYQADIAKGFWGLLLEEGGRHILKWPDPAAVKRPDWVKPDQWNRYVITAQGSRVTLEVNGVVTVDIEDEKGARSGVIAFQLHQGPAMEVQFKDVEIKVLEPGTPPRVSGKPGTPDERATPPAGLQAKMERLQKGVQKWRSEGKDLAPIATLLQGLEPLLQQGKTVEAEALLDRVIKRVEERE
jgi:putative heme-binding domain-containing protein